MSEHDQLDRIERKLNQIGRSILFGITLLAILAAIVTEPYYTPWFLVMAFWWRRHLLWWW